jgi:endonuclease/exonuclease/phosphatase family metal-dependent hydrolase
MTRNLYFGADLTPILTAAPADVPARAGEVFSAVVASRPTERMERIADEIAASRPHIVGLQEAVLWRSLAPSSFPARPPVPATDVEYDFIGSLLSGLAARGAPYAAVAVATGFDGQVPGLFPVGITGVLPPGLNDIRLTDRDAILVRTDLPGSEFRVLASGAANFAARYSIPVAGTTLEAIASYAFVDIEMSGHKFRAASTHLDPLVPPVQEAQAAELIGVLSGLAFPQIALGDFNSPADGSGTETYAAMLAAGFTDGWLEQGSGDGFTYGQAPDLLNDPSLLDERIDFVFHRGGLRTLSIEVVGDELADRTASGRWPSDHAGVLATLRLVPAPGTAALLLLGGVVLFALRPIRRAATR